MSNALDQAKAKAKQAEQAGATFTRVAPPTIDEAVKAIDEARAAAAEHVETEAQRLIRLAKENLTKERWVKGALVEGETACLVGGFKKIDGLEWLTEAGFARATQRLNGPIFTCAAAPFVLVAVRELFPDRLNICHAHDRVDLFNDHPDTKHADVMAVLDRAYVMAGETRSLRNDR